VNPATITRWRRNNEFLAEVREPVPDICTGR
jgi:hypothetical protein